MNLSNQVCNAVCEGKLSIVERFLSEGKGEDLEVLGEFKQTLLHLAVIVENEAVIEFLIDKGANLEALDRRKNTPLHLAVIEGNEAVVELLINEGANLEESDRRKNTPLHLAVIKGNEAVVGRLIDKGVQLAPSNAFAHTPFYLSIQNGAEDEVVRLLLKKGAYAYSYRPKELEYLNRYWENLAHSTQPDLSFYTVLLLAGVRVPENQTLPTYLESVKQAREATITEWLEPLKLSKEACCRLIPDILQVLPRLLHWVAQVKKVEETQRKAIEQKQAAGPTLRETLLVLEGDNEGLNEAVKQEREEMLKYLELKTCPNEILWAIRNALMQKALVVTQRQCYPMIPHDVADYLVAEVMADSKLCAKFHTKLFEHKWPELCKPPMTKSMEFYKRSLSP